jgi:alpha-L-fucosidase
LTHQTFYMSRLFDIFLLLIIIHIPCQSQSQPNRPLPSQAQLRWHDMEFYLFVHFGPNTFTDKEWGHGDEPADAFNSTQLDCRQWARIAKAAGAKGIIITAKHHDGFCLWPSKYSKHTVRQSKWKNGKGDVLKELSQACKEYGLKFGVYISPWDRNHPQYGTPAYNDVFVNMMKEIFHNYGPIWELWWDGANGEGPNGKKQVYDWHRFKSTVKKLSPNTVVFSDVGPHIRWIGNERGIAGKTNWNYLDTAGFTPGAGAPPVDTLNSGNEFGKAWLPGECDVSIRPGWFYHANEDDKVKTPEQLFDLYLKSVGRGANLLLNVPPDARGLIHANDSAALVGFKKLRDQSFKKNLARTAKGYFTVRDSASRATAVLTDGNDNTFQALPFPPDNPLWVQLDSLQLVNCIVLKENIKNGQHARHFIVTILYDKYKVLYKVSGTTIGRKRILTFPAVKADRIILSFSSGNSPLSISEIEAYYIDEKLIEQ